MDLKSVEKLVNEAVSREMRKVRLHDEMEKRFGRLFEGLSSEEREALVAVVQEQVYLWDIDSGKRRKHLPSVPRDEPSRDDSLPF